MNRLVLLRHGESTWNRENRFTGWTDVDLTEQGQLEAYTAGRLLRQEGFGFDQAYVSLLRRAIRTLWIVLDTMELHWLPVVKDWRLNERHYGALQGLNKAEIAEHYGLDRVHAWRRSYAARPPSLTATDPRHPRHDARYRGLAPERLPATESLADTQVRVLELWREQILPQLRAGRRILITAHGNTLRALIKYLEAIPDEEIARLDIPTGVPLVYEFGATLQVTARYYLERKTSQPELATTH
ncbi:MAG: 2,3-diphosphoglycerate-dependent phosphoglycerate mutase [Thiobacillaceae bacterium]|nr:2,3-diphosphoglycerate-dependent phosphoglycerate mutase [Thiobacillaceae bacterium]